MGKYLNPGNTSFVETTKSEIYVDKTEMLIYMNKILESKQKHVCVSRPRRFGKSITVEMLSAYYSRGCNSSELFENLTISQTENYRQYMNKYDVLRLDIQWLYGMACEAQQDKENIDVVTYIQTEVLCELKREYTDIVKKDEKSIAMALSDIHLATNRKFVIILDEWDCLFREEKKNEVLQKSYVTFLRGLFKGTISDEFLALAYMTGILPIKKYGTQSALNNFNEFTMINPGPMAQYVGFTEEEVVNLCDKYHMDFDEIKRWYDGYGFRKEKHIYSPKSVIEAMMRTEVDNYWTQTETYESLKLYIEMNYKGLRDAILIMLGGGRYPVNSRTFQNDMVTFESRDDVLTLLIHLGYLAYDIDTDEVYIPNQEVMEEYQDVLQNCEWYEVVKAIEESDKLLAATLQKDEVLVAKGIDEIHQSTTSLLTYNDENALSCVVSIAYYSARKQYSMIREMPSGKGFADIVFIPKRGRNLPALVVELKWNHSSESAIEQIKDKKYVKSLIDYSGDILLIGINYDKKSKQHQCNIEEYKK